ncbi:hypothetical protein ANANG_G00046300 [Anguilla anguilla]|uniref:Uncharacterized protein n=1 Tax=Anguilla anguilla TaxID=7936 RepID=A0A9D3S525_ANGAN|nr:hypothetical protein ANANG_G00046300 [Anguilla anguilla]
MCAYLRVCVRVRGKCDTLPREEHNKNLQGTGGPEREPREESHAAGGQQHLPTSSKQNKAPSVHPGFQPLVKRDTHTHARAHTRKYAHMQVHKHTNTLQKGLLLAS